MIKRLTAFCISCSLLFIGIINVGAAAASSSSSSVQSTILSGLWEGSNFIIPNGSASQSVPNRSAPTSSITTNGPMTSSPAITGTYAALGDSVAAGLGLPSQDALCGRSPQAYPYQVSQATGLPLVHVACSGATAGDIFTNQERMGRTIPPQLDAALASGNPSIITITAGANDAHWTGFLSECYTFSCGSRTDTLLASFYLVLLQAKLNTALNDIAARSGGTPPTAVVTGYYNPLSSSCTSLQQNVTANEINWLNGEVNALNQTLQNTSSQFSFVRFAPVNFTGHDICSAQPWVQGVNDPAPFHPTTQGQTVIAQAVLGALGR
ncbi:MAG: hydrolase family protein [Candidatus Saccharibacteria bacterium]|nr:hydrolase family protein [Candidatus Saccharibacteria bacterium]